MEIKPPEALTQLIQSLVESGEVDGQPLTRDQAIQKAVQQGYDPVQAANVWRAMAEVITRDGYSRDDRRRREQERRIASIVHRGRPRVADVDGDELARSHAAHDPFTALQSIAELASDPKALLAERMNRLPNIYDVLSQVQAGVTRLQRELA